MHRRLMGLAFAALSVLLLPQPTPADDTEIYRAEGSENLTGRPKVLIVFDDSGSMGDEVAQQRPPYNPNGTYDNKFDSDRIYWTTDGSIPVQGSSDWFDASQNRCAASFDNLSDDGVFQTTGARRWVDSQTIPGECTLSCPDGTTYFRNGNGVDDTRRGCYEETTTVVDQEVCVDNWRTTNRTEWLTYPEELRRTFVIIFFRVYQVNDRECTTEQVTTTSFTYVQPRIQICDADSVIPGTWQPLDGAVNLPPHVDCRNDAATSNSGNGLGIPSGYPRNNVVSGSEFGPSPNVSDGLWGTERYGFYTSHYLDWFYDESLEEPLPKIDIARRVISEIIASNEGVDFGLLEFNQGFRSDPIRNGRDGGRIVQRIISGMDEIQRASLITSVNQLTANGSTPLCESFYEAYRYIAGEPPVYANNAGSATYDPLAKDSTAEEGIGEGVRYRSPNTDCAYTYIIVMTDGRPQFDLDANSRIQDLTGETCSVYDTDDQFDGLGNRQVNCMPQLARYMATTDLDGDSSNGNQFGITYTIGFLTDQELLSDTAAAGEGSYYTANNAQELTEAFQGALVEIASTDTTFTSPAVAVDTFTRTQSRDAVYYAMFTPGGQVDWPGNIKKLRLDPNDGNPRLVDANGAPAIDEGTGFIKDTATTFWSAGQDGGSVTSGGVGGRLALTNPASRNIWIDTGANQALERFVPNNLDADAFGRESDADLWALFGTSTAEGFALQVAWGQGFDAYDVDGDGITNEARDWILGDILHSQPLVLNYGATTGFSKSNPDLRLVVGTNAGFVHMFGDTDGNEDWAFIPKELIGLLSTRRRNATTSENVYGMDLTAASYRLDVDQDGTIEPLDGDKVYLYLGMRRGGRSYYALDITNPDTPSFLWSKGPSDSGFAELGQTWSRPAVTFVPGYVDDNGKPKPVLIFGAGYDTRKDSAGRAGTDAMGRGVFIVDAATGAKVWSVTPNTSDSTNMQETGLLHSVAADVTAVDSNGDGISDRIYFGDTGGNLWRVDMPGNSLPDDQVDDWFIVKVASVNGGTVATDRRIHNAIDVVRTRFNGRAFDALVFATGDRTNPNATDVDNRLYMIRDEAVAAYTTKPPTRAQCGDEEFENDIRCQLPFTDAQLLDITSNSLAAEDDATVISSLSAVNGWRLDLTADGEKGLAKTVTLGGQIFAATFTPNDLLSDINICEPLSGRGKLYIVSLFDGDRSLLNLAPVIPDTPTIFIPPTTAGERPPLLLLLPPGTPPATGPVLRTGELFRPPYGNYWMQEGF
jgi:type IV pilus assembly protein PilY1